LRIIHVYRDFAVEGGVPSQVRALASAQSNLGHEVFYLDAPTAPPADARSVHLDGGLQSIPFRAAKHERWDAIHAHGALIPRDISVALRLGGGPRWLAPHGVLNPLGRYVRFGGGHHSLAASTAKFVYINGALRAALRFIRPVGEAPYEAEVLELLGGRPVSAIPMGVDTEWLRPPRHTPRRELETITYLGRLDDYHKGLDLLLHAMAALGSDRHRWRVRLVGVDARGSWDRLSTQVRELGLDNVSLEGPAWGDAKAQLLDETDWFWGGFRYAGMARAVGEALGAGVPVLASRAGNWGDWVERSGAGRIAPLTAPEIVAMLRSIPPVGSPSYQEMSAAATRVAHELSWAASAARTIDLYGATGGAVKSRI
jgi:glycosyltransferase involved in cell wall biosynthesis